MGGVPARLVAVVAAVEEEEEEVVVVVAAAVVVHGVDEGAGDGRRVRKRVYHSTG